MQLTFEYGGKMAYIALVVTVILIGIDQLIKLWAASNLIGEGSVPFIYLGDKEIINLSYHENTGAAFSIFSSYTGILIVITSLLLICVVVYVIKKKINKPFLLWSISLIVAGGVGNLIDRIIKGYVIDYVEVRIFKFAVFNFADCCVVIGAIMLISYIILSDIGKNKVKRTNE